MYQKNNSNVTGNIWVKVHGLNKLVWNLDVWYGLKPSISGEIQQ